MKRRQFMKVAGAGAAASAIAMPAVAQSSPEVKWRLTSSFPKSLDTIYGGGDVFAKKVAEMSGGKFQITVHAGGELMPPFGVVDAVQAARIETSSDFNYTPYVVAGVLFICLTIPMARLTDWAARRQGYQGAGGLL